MVKWLKVTIIVSLILAYVFVFIPFISATESFGIDAKVEDSKFGYNKIKPNSPSTGDTNVTTACSGGTYLLGNGTCATAPTASDVTWDYNQTIPAIDHLNDSYGLWWENQTLWDRDNWNTSAETIFAFALNYSVGIGTDSPRHKLTVRNGSIMLNTTGVDTAFIGLRDDGKSFAMGTGTLGSSFMFEGDSYWSVAGTSRESIAIGNIVGNDVLRIAGDGTMWLGESIFAPILQINGSAGGTSESYLLSNLSIKEKFPNMEFTVNGSGNFSADLFVQGVNVTMWFYNQSDGNTGGLFTTNTTAMWNETVQKVGIGTGVPQYPLHVITETNTSTLSLGIITDGQQNTSLVFTSGSNTLSQRERAMIYSRVIAGNTASLHFLTDSAGLTEKMVIDEWGRVGIGVTEPETSTTTLLEVGGSANISADLFVQGVNVTMWFYNQSDGAGGNPFDQELNSTMNVTFGTLNITDHAIIDHFLSAQNNLYFSFYDDGSELYLNTSGENFNIETENSKIVVFNEPNQANDYKLFQVFNKQGSSETEFVTTAAGDNLNSYFTRSLAVGTGAETSPFNCTTYAEHLNCMTDLDGGGDLYVGDDIELNGTIWVNYGEVWIGGKNTSTWLYNQTTAVDFTNVAYLNNSNEWTAQNEFRADLLLGQDGVGEGSQQLQFWGDGGAMSLVGYAANGNISSTGKICDSVGCIGDAVAGSSPFQVSAKGIYNDTAQVNMSLGKSSVATGTLSLYDTGHTTLAIQTPTQHKAPTLDFWAFTTGVGTTKHSSILYNDTTSTLDFLSQVGDFNFRGGNVGIGTGSPIANLEIGDASVTKDFARDPYVVIGGGSLSALHIEGSDQAEIFLDDSGGSANNQISQIVQVGDTLRMRQITDGGALKHTALTIGNNQGNIGINASSPTTALHIEGVGRGTAGLPLIFLNHTTGGSSGIIEMWTEGKNRVAYIGKSGSNGYWLQYQNGTVKNAFYSAGDSYFRGGVLEIGTGTQNHATGVGDLYVQDDLEVDGMANLDSGNVVFYQADGELTYDSYICPTVLTITEEDVIINETETDGTYIKETPHGGVLEALFLPELEAEDRVPITAHKSNKIMIRENKPEVAHFKYVKLEVNGIQYEPSSAEGEWKTDAYGYYMEQGDEVTFTFPVTVNETDDVYFIAYGYYNIDCPNAKRYFPYNYMCTMHDREVQLKQRITTMETELCSINSGLSWCS